MAAPACVKCPSTARGFAPAPSRLSSASFSREAPVPPPLPFRYPVTTFAHYFLLLLLVSKSESMKSFGGRWMLSDILGISWGRISCANPHCKLTQLYLPGHYIWEMSSCLFALERKWQGIKVRNQACIPGGVVALRHYLQLQHLCFLFI